MNINKALCFLFGICSTAVTSHFRSHHAVKKLDTLFEWHKVEFDYPSEEDRESAINNGSFVPGNSVILDTDVYYGDNKTSIFVTFPKFKKGLPVALGIVTNETRDGDPIIKPYPSWKWHSNPEACNTNRIVSVYRVAIDECERLWVLDTGGYAGEIICPPQVLAFDLKTDKIISRYEIPSSQIISTSLLVTPVVDVRETCNDTFLYLADCKTFSIIIYDVQRNTSWKVIDKTMYPYPTYGTFSIQGDTWDLMDGVLGMALSPYVRGQDRTLYFHAMSSPTENFVLTSYLRNQSFIEENDGSIPQIFHTYRGQRKTQSAAEAIDKNGILYFGLMSDVKLACFNTDGEYGDPASMGIVGDDPVTMQFASGVKIVNNRHNDGQELRVVTSRFQKVATGTMNTSEVNFRILSGQTAIILQGTNCNKIRNY